MNTTELLSAIDSVISRLQRIRAFLTGGDGTRGAFSGIEKRTLSANSRARIAASQRKRWAKQQKRAAKETA